MHTRLQLDLSARITLRQGNGDAIEVVILDPNSECSTVIELSPAQLAVIAQGTVR